jgi:hypothetical protein
LTARNPNNPNQGTTTTGVSGSQSGQTTDQAKQSASEVTDQAKQAAAQVTDQAKQAAQSQLAVRKDQTAHGLNTVSAAVQDMGNKLRQNDQTSSYAQFADQAAHQIQRFSSYLRNHDVRDIVDDAEDWMRRDPMIALGGAFVLGLLGARFLKSSGVKKNTTNSRNSGRQVRYRPDYRYNDQYYQYGYGQYGANRGYRDIDRTTGRYPDDRYGRPAQETEETPYQR